MYTGALDNLLQNAECFDVLKCELQYRNVIENV